LSMGALHKLCIGQLCQLHKVINRESNFWTDDKWAAKSADFGHK